MRLLHRRDDMSLEELQKHLRIEEETRSRDPKPHNSNVNVAEGSKNNKDKGKGKGVLKANNDGKFKKKFHGECFNCGKKGHKASECRNKKKEGKEGSTSNINPNSNSKRANVVEEKSEDIVAMISEWSISMITEANMAAITKTFDW